MNWNEVVTARKRFWTLPKRKEAFRQCYRFFWHEIYSFWADALWSSDSRYVREVCKAAITMRRTFWSRYRMIRSSELAADEFKMKCAPKYTVSRNKHFFRPAQSWNQIVDFQITGWRGGVCLKEIRSFLRSVSMPRYRKATFKTRLMKNVKFDRVKKAKRVVWTLVSITENTNTRPSSLSAQKRFGSVWLQVVSICIPFGPLATAYCDKLQSFFASIWHLCISGKYYTENGLSVWQITCCCMCTSNESIFRASGPLPVHFIVL